MNDADNRPWKPVLALAGALLQQYMPWQGMAIVVILTILDWLLGTSRALRTGTWTFVALRNGARKLFLWAVLLVAAAALRHPWGSATDGLQHVFGDYIVFYMVLSELLSVLRNVVVLAIMDGIHIPGLDTLIDVLQRWGEQGLAKLRDGLPVTPAVPPPVSSAESPPKTG